MANSLDRALYLIEILHQTTTNVKAVRRRSLLYLIEILHQTTTLSAISLLRFLLYLIEILHQTTTLRSRKTKGRGCILSKFYIKPQHVCCQIADCPVVSYRNSTSNHNGKGWLNRYDAVVSYRNSTSNHNSGTNPPFFRLLYLIEILHQTTTVNADIRRSFALYLIEILHQTTTRTRRFARRRSLYLIEILHQTTT